MAIIARSDWASDLLINYVARVIDNLEPELHFGSLGVKEDVPAGYDQLAFGRANKLTQTATQLTLNEVPASAETTPTPTGVSWGSTAYKAGPTRLGLIVKVTDLLIRNSAVEVIRNAAKETRNNLLRGIDSHLQTVVNGSTTSTQIIYAGGKSSRSGLASGDVATPDLFVKAVGKMRKNNVKPYANNFYPALIHPFVMIDVMQNTGAGSWLDIARYTSPQELIEGKIGGYRGLRFLESSNIDTFSSTVTVYPTTIVGQESYGWGYFIPPTPVIINAADALNPLQLYSSIGAKVALGVTRFEEERIVRIESATDQS